MLRALTTSIAACLALLLSASEAKALSCVRGITHDEALARSALVFEGVVVGEPSEVRVPGVPFQHPEYRFRVGRYLHGEAGVLVAVHQQFEVAGSPPEMQPRAGEAWRVYAERRAPGKYAFELCPPRRYAVALEEPAASRVRELLAAEAGRQPAESADDSSRLSPWLFGLAGIAIAATLAYGLKRRHERGA